MKLVTKKLLVRVGLVKRETLEYILAVYCYNYNVVVKFKVY